MMIARVLKTVDNFAIRENDVTGRRLIVQEMDICIRRCKEVSFIAEDTVGAATGDLVLCSQSRAWGSLAVVGIIDTVELVGTRVYDKKTKRFTDEAGQKTMDKQ